MSCLANEISDRQFLGWNEQVRNQLVLDLYDTCRQDGEILETILDEYVYLLKDNTERLDELKSWTDDTLGTDDETFIDINNTGGKY